MNDANSLYHYGVEGMHWGVRRYQNYDGTRKIKNEDERLEYMKKYNAKKAVEKKYNDNIRTHKVEDDLASLHIVSNTARNSVNAQKDLIDRLWKDKPKEMDLSNISDDELRKRINRIDMERRYSSLTASHNRKKEKAKEILDVTGDVLAVGASAAVIGAQIYKLKHSDLDDITSIYHYGVEGMHWGVRRYQNEDGSLTSLGKKHAESSKSDEGLSNKTKHAILAGASVAALGAVTVASVRLHNKHVAKAATDMLVKEGTTIQRIAKDGEKFTDFDRFYAASSAIDKKAYPGIIKKGDKIVQIGVNSDVKVAGSKEGEKIYKALQKTDKDFGAATKGVSYYDFNRKLGIVKGEYTKGKIFAAPKKQNFDDVVDVNKMKNDAKYYQALKESGYGGVRDLNDMIANPLKTDAPIILLKDVDNYTIKDISNKTNMKKAQGYATVLGRQIYNPPKDNTLVKGLGVTAGATTGVLAADYAVPEIEKRVNQKRGG